MSTPRNLGQLGSNDWQQLQDLADRFYAAWAAGGPVDLERFLPPAGDRLRAVTLQELVTIDLEMRWRRGQPQALDYYLEKYPELGPARALPAALVFQEYHARQRFGDRPALASYRERFPDQFEELAKLATDETRVPSGTAAATPPPTPAREGADGQDEGVLAVMGGYKLRQRIGSAAFGEVYSADAPGGVPVAVKILFRPVDEEEAQRELSALQLVRVLRHHALVHLHAFWPSNERLYIVMELADGSLRDRLDACRREGLRGIPHDELLHYFRDAAEGLDYLHANHVQHRDVKPENVLLVQGHAKLADFGLARQQGSKMLSTATGAGTPLYMAPEVFRGQISPHSDQYSLAMAYAELRLDRRLVRGVNVVELMLEHLEGTPDLSGLPTAEQQVILKALSKEPAQRYPSCVAWIEALEEVRHRQGAAATAVVRKADEPGAPAAPDTVSEAPWKPRRPQPGGQRGRRAGQRSAAVLKQPRPRRFRRAALLLVLLLAATGLGLAGVYGLPRLFPPGGGFLVSVSTTRSTENGTAPAPSGRAGPSTGPEGSPPPKGTEPARRPADTARKDTGPAKEPTGPPPSLTLETPEPVVLGTGEKATIPVHFQRNFRDPVRLTFAGLPEGVTVPEVPAAAPGAASAEVPVTVAARAALGTSQVTLYAEGAGLRKQATLKLTVVFLPGGFERAAPDVVADLGGRGKPYFRRVRRPIAGGGAVEFVLIPKGGKDDPDTFYLMADKASVGLFRRFLAETKTKVRPGWNESAGDRVPVFDVRVEDAGRFARWLGGGLPSPAQWDKAAGLHDRGDREGPFRGEWEAGEKPQIAVGRTEPLPVGEARDDVSVFGCRDMAGNGWEWTSAVVDSTRRVPDLRPGDKIRLRGRSYTDDGPLLFREMDEPGQPVFRACPADVTLPDLGFRVAIEPK